MPTGPTSCTLPTSRRMLIAGLLVLASLLSLLAAQGTCSEPPTGEKESAQRDSLPPEVARADSTREAGSKSWLTQLLDDYLYAKTSPESLRAEDMARPEDLYLPYQGRIIRHIRTERLDIFTGVSRTEKPEREDTLNRLGNATHVYTRDWVIRDYFLMKEGEPLDPFTLADTERILRTTGFLRDVRIVVRPVPDEPDSVDLLVASQDVWSLGFSVPSLTSSAFRIKVYERNLLGWGHEVEFQSKVNIEIQHSDEQLFFYRLDNLLGTFTRGELRHKNNNRERMNGVTLARSPIVPQIRVSGAASLDAVTRKETDEGKIAMCDLTREAYDRWDTWLGYSFPLGKNEAGGPGRVQLFPSIRATWVNFSVRPDGIERINLRYQDRVVVLTGLTLSRSEYREARLVYGYGTKEDIPYGYRIAFSGGAELGRVDGRGYAEIEVGGAHLFESFGTTSASLELGEFLNDGVWEDGVLRTHIGYFSPLSKVRRFMLRNFFLMHYTAGINRREDETIVLGDRTGIRGLRSSPLRGIHRLAFNFDTLAFLPGSLFGFKSSVYGFYDVAAVANAAHDLLTAKYYSSIGIGFRILNESLVFNTLDIRLTYFPTVPEGSDPEYFRVGSIREFEPRSYEPGPPSIVAFW